MQVWGGLLAQNEMDFAWHLARRETVLWVVGQEFHDEVHAVVQCMRNQLGDTAPFLRREIQFHVRSMALELFQNLFRWRAHNVVNLVDLVQLVRARE